MRVIIRIRLHLSVHIVKYFWIRVIDRNVEQACGTADGLVLCQRSRHTSIEFTSFVAVVILLLGLVEENADSISAFTCTSQFTCELHREW